MHQPTGIILGVAATLTVFLVEISALADLNNGIHKRSVQQSPADCSTTANSEFKKQMLNLPLTQGDASNTTLLLSLPAGCFSFPTVDTSDGQAIYINRFSKVVVKGTGTSNVRLHMDFSMASIAVDAGRFLYRTCGGAWDSETLAFDGCIG